TRQHVTPYDDMAQYLCTERPMPILGQDPPVERAGRGLAAPPRPESGRGDLGRGTGHEPMRPPAAPRPEPGRSGRALPADPIRSGRDALMASLDRPLAPEQPGTPAAAGELARPSRPVSGGAAALTGTPATPSRGGRGSAFDEDPDAPKEVPAVPSLAVLRPRRTGAPAGPEQPG